MEKTASEIAEFIGGELVGDGNIVIRGVAPSKEGRAGDITFAENERHLREAEETPASAVIVGRGIAASKKTIILVDNPKLSFCTVLRIFHPPKRYEPGIHPGAVIGADCRIDPTARVGPHATIGDSVKIGAGSVIRAGAFVGDCSSIGEECRINPNVAIHDRTLIGNRVTIHSGSVIGGDGFGYVRHEGKHVKIPQVGNVIIEDDVEIGSNVSIDRAAIGSTTIKKGTKIDNLVQIAHNNTIGENTIIVSQVGISGSVTIGNNVTIAGQVGISDHLTIGDNVVIGAQAGLPTGKDLPPGTVWLGSPARPIKKMMKQFAAVSWLPNHYKEFAKLREEVKDLKERLAAPE